MDLNKAMEGLNKENFIIKQRTGYSQYSTLTYRTDCSAVRK
jgi:hypothetical protein